jgi:RHS repeat-associated protein
VVCFNTTPGSANPTHCNGFSQRAVTLDGPSMATIDPKYNYDDTKDYRARYYEPSAGRFINEDPIGLGGGLNRFRYAHNEPITRKDPTGLLDVFTWKARDGYGHASIRLQNGTYISWWPSAHREGNKNRCDCPKDNLYHAPANSDQTYEDDVAGEDGHSPDEVIHIDGLNEDAIASWWSAFKNNPQNNWNTSSQNCSTTVYDALRSGGGFPTYVPVWNPAAVSLYSHEVQLQMKLYEALTWIGPI